MGVRPRLVAAFAWASLSLSACEQPTSATDFVDGRVEMSEHAAFSTTLYHEDGEPTLGANIFYLRVAMPDPDVAPGLGRGVPGLDISVDATTTDGSAGMEVAAEVSYQGNGVYRVAPITFDRDGPWNMDFAISVGEIDDSVRFSFYVEG